MTVLPTCRASHTGSREPVADSGELTTTIYQLPNYQLPTTNYGRNRQDRIGISAADTAADEGTGDVADGAGASDERVAAIHNEGASPGRELLVPHRGEARQRAENGLFP